MKTLKPKSIRPINTTSEESIKKVLSTGLNRYNNIRDGIMMAFKQHSTLPIIMYKMAAELNCIAMLELQDGLTSYVNEMFDGTKKSKMINYDKWTNVFDLLTESDSACWKKVIGILNDENVKSIELFRISAELSTSSFENFIQALGHYMEEKKK